MSRAIAFLRATKASLALLCSAGCAGFLHPTAESFLSLRGKVANAQPGTACDLQLYTEKGQPRGQLAIAFEFERSLVIAPGAHRYYVEVSCVGQPGRFRSATYELGGAARTLDLGAIVLSSK